MSTAYVTNEQSQPPASYSSKRALDVFLSLLGILISSPFWVTISLIIYIEDRGPVFFYHDRLGRLGKPFHLIKFRTMHYNPQSKNVVVDLEKDYRVTKIGKALRATALDELPSLVNILKGDMSFVGPRSLPFKIEDDEKNRYDNITQVPGYKLRCSMKPGLTGLAQVYAPRTLDRVTKFQYDNEYLKKMNLWFDIKLIILSCRNTLLAKWDRSDIK